MVLLSDPLHQHRRLDSGRSALKQAHTPPKVHAFFSLIKSLMKWKFKGEKKLLGVTRRSERMFKHESATI